MSNLQFLTFFINTKAVNDNESLLELPLHRLVMIIGLAPMEAPPAIISVFIGEQLTKVLARTRRE
jgi:glutamine synthetase